ncbi:MAG: HAD-IC family P-type ATPase [Propionibacteriaceae bacterium]|nr:HAD-IC family P-type ATPase [Propionibacteriaceae bacterium]
MPDDDTTQSGSGLTGAEVRLRVEQGRVNRTRQVTSRPLWQIVKANVLTRFNGLLGALFIMVMLTGSYIDGLFGLALVLNSALGIGQEWYAKRKLDSLAVLHAPTAVVRRDGREVTVDTGDVVQDDLVFLATGAQVPADGPILSSDNLEVDESNLTGESDAIAKAVGDQVSSGTAVVAGSGWFRAATVGSESTAQRLSSQARVFTRAYSEVQHSTNVLLRWLTWIVIVMFPIAVLAQSRVLGWDDWRAVVLRSTGALVGLVPEGLVLLTTLAFLLAALQLTRQQALVQELPAVEGLARVDVICCDKTGTLTQGEIVYQDWTLLEGWPSDSAWAALGALAHDPRPNATAAAIGRAVPDPGQPVVRRAAFSSARKWSGVELADGSAWVLGAPEILLTGQTELLERVQDRAAQGCRVVVLGRVDGLPEPNQGLGPVQPVAWVELAEAIRPDAAETLAYFASQGVTVKVISGDNPVTVAAVARRVGLEVTEAVDARQLPDDPAQLAQVADRVTVFGRVTPGRKRDLVEALQSLGHTVAMTGDGVNDVLALKEADIGIAMGNGAQATKAVAQLVLLDSQFSHLPRVLAEGRRLIANVERVAALFVTKNVMTAVAMLSTALLGLTFPFLPRHLTLVSVLTIGIPSAVLALGANKRRYLPGFLARVLALALPAGLAAGLAVCLAFTLAWGDRAQQSTLALAVLLAINFWLLGALARPYNWWKITLLATMAGCAVLAFAIPACRDFLQLSLPRGELLLAIVLGVCGAVVVELSYRWSRRVKRHQPTGPAELIEQRRQEHRRRR